MTLPIHPDFKAGRRHRSTRASFEVRALMLAALSAAPICGAEDIINVARISEELLLTSVTRGADPICPRRAESDAKTGAIVAQVEISASGQLESIAILEAPSIPLAACVRSALSAWTFRPLGGNYRYQGKLTFYSVAGAVKRAADVGYVGH